MSSKDYLISSAYTPLRQHRPIPSERSSNCAKSSENIQTVMRRKKRRKHNSLVYQFSDRRSFLHLLPPPLIINHRSNSIEDGDATHKTLIEEEHTCNKQPVIESYTEEGNDNLVSPPESISGDSLHMTTKLQRNNYDVIDEQTNGTPPTYMSPTTDGDPPTLQPLLYNDRLQPYVARMNLRIARPSRTNDTSNHSQPASDPLLKNDCRVLSSESEEYQINSSCTSVTDHSLTPRLNRIQKPSFIRNSKFSSIWFKQTIRGNTHRSLAIRYMLYKLKSGVPLKCIAQSNYYSISLNNHQNGFLCKKRATKTPPRPPLPLKPSDNLSELQAAASSFCASMRSKLAAELSPNSTTSAFTTIRISDIQSFVSHIRSQTTTGSPLSFDTFKREARRRERRVSSERNTQERLEVVLLATLKSVEHILSETLKLREMNEIPVDEIDCYVTSNEPSKISHIYCIKRVTLYASTHISKQHCYKYYQLFPSSWRPSHLPFTPNLNSSSHTQAITTSFPISSSVELTSRCSTPMWTARIALPNDEVQERNFSTKQHGYEKARHLAHATYDEVSIPYRGMQTIQHVNQTTTHVQHSASPNTSSVPEGMYVLMDESTGKELAFYGVVSGVEESQENLFSITRNYREGETRGDTVRRIKYAAAAWFFCKCVEKAKACIDKDDKWDLRGSNKILDKDNYTESQQILAEQLINLLIEIVTAKKKHKVGIRWNRLFLAYEYFVFKTSEASMRNDETDGRCLLHEVCQVGLLTLSNIRVTLKHVLLRLRPFLSIKKVANNEVMNTENDIKDANMLSTVEATIDRDPPVIATDLDKALKYMVYLSLPHEFGYEGKTSSSPPLIKSSVISNQMKVDYMNEMRSLENGSKKFEAKIWNEDKYEQKEAFNKMEATHLSFIDPGLQRYSLQSGGEFISGVEPSEQPLNRLAPVTRSALRRNDGCLDFPFNNEAPSTKRMKNIFRCPVETMNGTLIPTWWRFCKNYQDETMRYTSVVEREDSNFSDDDSDAPSTISIDEGLHLQHVSAYPTMQCMMDASLVSLTDKKEPFPSYTLIQKRYPYISTTLYPTFAAENDPFCLTVLKHLFPSIYQYPSFWRGGGQPANTIEAEEIGGFTVKGEYERVLSSDNEEELDDLILGGEDEENIDTHYCTLEMMPKEEMFICLRNFNGFSSFDFKENHLDWLLNRLQLDPALKSVVSSDDKPVTSVSMDGWYPANSAFSVMAASHLKPTPVLFDYLSPSMDDTSPEHSTKQTQLTKKPHLLPSSTMLLPSRRGRKSHASLASDRQGDVVTDKQLHMNGRDTSTGRKRGRIPMSAKLPLSTIHRPRMPSKPSLDSPSNSLPTGVYFDASRQLWRCQWRENGRFKTKGFSLAHFCTLDKALMAAIEFRCSIGGIEIKPEWLDPSFAHRFVRRGNPRRRGMMAKDDKVINENLYENHDDLVKESSTYAPNEDMSEHGEHSADCLPSDVTPPLSDKGEETAMIGVSSTSSGVKYDPDELIKKEITEGYSDPQ